MLYRMLCRMKVTANIPDELIDEVKRCVGGRTITESLIVALKEWVALRSVRDLNEEIRQAPLEFIDGYSTTSIRDLNRQP